MEFELPHDPVILLGMINMKLRDFYKDMDTLCDDMDLNFDDIDQTLKAAGFTYDVHTNQYHKI